ncbi:hypothetical protein BDZ90DRAFT_232988 [Jaminaea rosea]|uniref:histone acetyltransferase n=1 Tax=Jaminaea rosea TaxID=1569628 RepID=A0A316USP0_9BASI|nr:hypothetical protein BDZ90DRAFT_232988 [Jaminaea rosea]PWN26893.1 hypothetical protein BDZ90DRAFT_232988 [Jaminaea rosea]
MRSSRRNGINTNTTSKGPATSSTSTRHAPLSPSQPLLNHLIANVRSLPKCSLPTGSGHLTLSVLFSPPRMAKVLYPWAHLDDPRGIAAGSRPFPQQTVQTWEEMVFFHAEWRRADQHEDDVKMICAIEAYNYSLPEYGSQVFYLSKLDTTGWAPRLQSAKVQKHLLLDGGKGPSPSSGSAGPVTSLTTHLTVSFLSYFLSLRHKPSLPTPSRPLRHSSCHILARAQEAYIFPNSPENPAKKPLSDAKLVVWWRQTLSQVVEAVRVYHAGVKEGSKGEGKSNGGLPQQPRIDACYMIPGLEKLESHPLVPLPPSMLGKSESDSPLARAQWRYGHPYSTAGSGRHIEDLPPLPLHLPLPAGAVVSSSREHQRGIATLLPRFEDDPQSRFLDELAGEGDEIGKFGHLLRPPPTSGTTSTAPQQNMDVESQATLLDEDSQMTLLGYETGMTSRSNSGNGSSTAIESQPFDPRPQRTPKKPRLAERVMDLRAATPPRRSFSNSTSTPPTSRPSSPMSSPGGGPVRRSPRKHSPVKAAVTDGELLNSPSVSEIVMTTRSGLVRTPSVSPTKRVRPNGATTSSPSTSSSQTLHAPSSPLAPTTAAVSSTGPRLTQPQLSALRSRLALDAVSPDEFWERMAFRQECSSGNLVGSFFLGVTLPSASRRDAKEDEEMIPASLERPTHTIPLRELSKAMRTNLQLDDCYWQRDRDAVELTQYFDEERGKLLCHSGRLEESEKIEGEEGWRVGRGVVWDDVLLEGFGQREVDKAKEAALKEIGEGQAEATERKPVTMLSVKRKKPPTA